MHMFQDSSTKTLKQFLINNKSMISQYSYDKKS